MRLASTASARPVDRHALRVSVGLAGGAPERQIARVLARELQERGLLVDVAEQLVATRFDAEMLVLGAATSLTALAALECFVLRARAQLATTATALFLVCDPDGRDPLAEIDNVVRRLRWRPDLVAALGSSEPHVGTLLQRTHQHPHHDWSVSTAADVCRLAEAIAVGLTRADSLHVPH